MMCPTLTHMDSTSGRRYVARRPLHGLPEAEAVIGEGETRDHGHPGFHPLPQMGF